MKEINGLNEDMGKMKEELKVHAENDPAVLDAMGRFLLQVLVYLSSFLN